MRYTKTFIYIKKACDQVIENDDQIQRLLYRIKERGLSFKISFMSDNDEPLTLENTVISKMYKSGSILISSNRKGVIVKNKVSIAKIISVYIELRVNYVEDMIAADESRWETIEPA